MFNIPEFGIKRENEERRDGGCAVVFDPVSQKYGVYRNLKNKMLGLYGGGFDEHEEFELKWVNPKDLFSIWELHSEDKNYDHWIYFLTKSVNRAIELGYDTTSQKM